MRSSWMAILVLAILSAAGRAQQAPALPDADRIRLAEAFQLAEALGNRVWPDWNKAPFAVLLVTPDQEFLIRHPKPSPDFTLAGDDALLKSKVWRRARKFPANFLATFPAVGGINTIVVGQAENTESKSSTRWVITVLHEHFHQLQNTQPRYYADVDSLGLARGDTTGMWMLNFPFPYDKAEVKDQFSAMSKALLAALHAREKPDFADKLAAYVQSRNKFRSLLQPDEYKYFAFQIWQEGIARYTEHRLAVLAAAEHQPSPQFKKLKDFRTFRDVADEIFTGIEKDLATVQLDKAKRTVVYNYGAAEGLVLDHAKPDWRKRYFEERFSLDRNFRSEK